MDKKQRLREFQRELYELKRKYSCELVAKISSDETRGGRMVVEAHVIAYAEEIEDEQQPAAEPATNGAIS